MIIFTLTEGFISENWKKIIATAQSLRHEIHSYPELSWQEKATSERIRKKLTSLNIPWQVCADTGTVAMINHNAKQHTAPHIALRGDMDALPIQEQTGKEWTSKHSGCMHACGHDGHTATLLATAEWLKLHENKLAGKVTLLFQPAEEGGHGAKKMIEKGALNDVDEIYGWHNWPAIPFGKIVCPDDIVMCGNGTFSVLINGKGGHASQPELCRNPVLAASAITLNLQQIVNHHLPPGKTAVVSVTSIDAPSTPTVIPEQAKLSGSIRFADQQTRDQINDLIKQISQETAESFGVECEVTISPRYDATINHPEQANKVRQIWQQDNEQQQIDENIKVPIMASEDFHYYLNEIPGAFVLVGADDGNGNDVPCHSQYYDFNDHLIPLVTKLYAQIVGAPVPAA